MSITQIARNLIRRSENVRASVGFASAALFPVMIGGTALGVEVTAWGAAKMGLQRGTDIAAIAGALNYKTSTNYTSITNIAGAQQTAAIFAARMAQLNGGAGTATPTWDANTLTLYDNQVTTQIVNGVQDASNVAVKVTINRTVPRMLTGFFGLNTPITVSATSVGELVYQTTPGHGGSPCVVGLGTSGVTTDTTITVSGGSNLSAADCTVRSNSGVTVSGGSIVSAQAGYLGGTLTLNGGGSFFGVVNPNQGQIPDPYSGRSDLQTALGAANTAAASTTVTCNGSACTPAGSVTCDNNAICTLAPGTYAGLKLSAGTNLALSPGLFVFTGDIKSSGGGSVTGSNVTVLMGTGSTINLAASTVSLSAATVTSATNHQLPGIVFASQSTSNGNISGSSSVPLTGVIYYPNGQFQVDGSSGGGSNTCAVLIAKSVVLTGNSRFAASDCDSYNVPTFYSIPATTFRKAAVVR